MAEETPAGRRFRLIPLICASLAIALPAAAASKNLRKGMLI
jgi:hypothetical protein